MSAVHLPFAYDGEAILNGPGREGRAGELRRGKLGRPRRVFLRARLRGERERSYAEGLDPSTYASMISRHEPHESRDEPQGITLMPITRMPPLCV